METASRLIDHIVTTTYQSLPAQAIASCKRFMLDTLAAALVGSSATGWATVAACLTAWGGTPQSTLWTIGQRLPAPFAAFANGMMAHAREYDVDYNFNWRVRIPGSFDRRP